MVCGASRHLIKEDGSAAPVLTNEGITDWGPLNPKSKGKYLGATLTNERGVEDVWQTHADLADAEATRLRPTATTASLFTRVNIARTRLASKLNFPTHLQVPPKSTQKKPLDTIQKALNKTLFPNNAAAIKIQTAWQSRRDLGCHHLNFEEHLRAQWASLTKLAVCDHANKTYKNHFHHAIKRIYGPLAAHTQHLLTSNCAFRLLDQAPDGAISEHMRACIAAWGSLPPSDRNSSTHLLQRRRK